MIESRWHSIVPEKILNHSTKINKYNWPTRLEKFGVEPIMARTLQCAHGEDGGLNFFNAGYIG